MSDKEVALSIRKLADRIWEEAVRLEFHNPEEAQRLKMQSTSLHDEARRIEKREAKR